MNLNIVKSNITQNTPEWLQMRKSYIGASDAPVIMGASKFKFDDGRRKTPNLLWKEKLGLETFSVSHAGITFGKEKESEARELYEVLSGNEVLPAVRFHKELDFLMASLDGLSLCEKYAVEIKCANAEDHQTAKEGKIPFHYYPQLQHQIEVLGLGEMDYFSYHKGEGIIVNVKRDDIYISKMIELEKEFWDFVMDMKEPPLSPLDFHEQNDEWKEVAKQLCNQKDRIKRAKEELKLLEIEKSNYEDMLIRLSEGKNSKKDDYFFSKESRKGRVDYNSIPELSDVDLEKYRKEPTFYWTIKKRGPNEPN